MDRRGPFAQRQRNVLQFDDGFCVTESVLYGSQNGGHVFVIWAFAHGFQTFRSLSLPQHCCPCRDSGLRRQRRTAQDRRLRRQPDGRIRAGCRRRVSPKSCKQRLQAKGHDVVIANAGVSGDTTSGGLARLDWSVPDGTEIVILELGANDMLRGVAPDITEQEPRRDDRAAEGSATSPCLLAGMRAAPNLGPDYQAAFDAIYPGLAEEIWRAALSVLPRRRRRRPRIFSGGRHASECRRHRPHGRALPAGNGKDARRKAGQFMTEEINARKRHR